MFLSTTSSSIEHIGQLIILILMFVFVLFLAYIAARVAGGFQSNALNRKNNIKIIEVCQLGNNKYIEIVKVGKRYLTLAISKDNVIFLTELDASEVTEHQTSVEPINFKSILEKMKNERKDKEQ